MHLTTVFNQQPTDEFEPNLTLPNFHVDGSKMRSRLVLLVFGWITTSIEESFTIIS